MRLEITKIIIIVLLLAANLFFMFTLLGLKDSDEVDESLVDEVYEILASDGIIVDKSQISFTSSSTAVYQIPLGDSYYERAAKAITHGDELEMRFDTPEGEAFRFTSGASVVFSGKLDFYFTAEDSEKINEYLALAREEFDFDMPAVQIEELPRVTYEIGAFLGGDEGNSDNTASPFAADLKGAYYDSVKKVYVLLYTQSVGASDVKSNEVVAVISEGRIAAMCGKWIFAGDYESIESQITDNVNILFSAKRIIKRDASSPDDGLSAPVTIKEIKKTYLVYYSSNAGTLFLIPGATVSYDEGECCINYINGDEYTK